MEVFGPETPPRVKIRCVTREEKESLGEVSLSETHLKRTYVTYSRVRVDLTRKIRIVHFDWRDGVVREEQVVLLIKVTTSKDLLNVILNVGEVYRLYMETLEEWESFLQYTIERSYS